MAKERNLLLESCELIFRYGVKNLTMDDVSQHLGISKKTLYQVVENKADLIEKVIALVINKNKDDIGIINTQHQNVIEELVYIYQHQAAMGKRMIPSLLFELKKYYPSSWQMLESFKSEFIYQCVLTNLQKGIESGLYRNDMNIEVIAKIYSSRVLEIFNADLFPPDKYSNAMVLKEMFMYHVRGIASKKGLDYLGKITLEF